MELVEVTTPATKKAFLQLPFRIYRNDPHWIPHLKQDIEKVFNPKTNKFFRHGEVTRWILKNDSGEVIGRVAAFINNKTAKTFDQPTGGMGFFECIDDQEAAFMLFDRCKSWLQERGMEAMEGPVNFGEKDKFWGLIIENYEAPGYYQQAYNPEYYKAFFEAYGFKVYYEQHIYYRDIAVPLQDKYIVRAERLKETPGYSVRTIDPKNLEKFAKDFMVIYNAAWARSHSNFSTMNKAGAMLAMKAMKPILDPDQALFAYYEDRPIGFFISLPNVNEIFRYANGNLNWLGKLKFLYYRWRKISRTCIGVAFGIDPEFQGKGVESLMIDLYEEKVRQPGKFDHLYVAWIGDFNPKMISIVQGLGTELFRRLATYVKLFDETKPFSRRPINRNAKS